MFFFPFFLSRFLRNGQISSSSNDRAKRSDNESPVDKTSIIFTLNNQVGGLARALQVFQELGINVLHLELQNTRADVDQVYRNMKLKSSNSERKKKLKIGFII